MILIKGFFLDRDRLVLFLDVGGFFKIEVLFETKIDYFL